MAMKFERIKNRFYIRGEKIFKLFPAKQIKSPKGFESLDFFVNETTGKYKGKFVVSEGISGMRVTLPFDKKPQAVIAFMKKFKNLTFEHVMKNIIIQTKKGKKISPSYKIVKK